MPTPPTPPTPPAPKPVDVNGSLSDAFSTETYKWSAKDGKFAMDVKVGPGPDAAGNVSLTVDQTGKLTELKYNVTDGAKGKVDLLKTALPAPTAATGPTDSIGGTDAADKINGLLDTRHHVYTLGAGADSGSMGNGGDTVYGGADNDTINPGAGADFFDGGDGRDCVNYVNSTGAVTVDLEHQIGAGGYAEGDRLANIEQVRGSNFNDVLIASHLGSDLKGGGGNDVLIGGTGNDELRGDAGKDILFGGAGADWIVFDPSKGWDGQQDTMLDFRASDGDWIDLHLIDGGFATGRIADYVKLVDQADGVHVMFDAAGTVATTGGTDILLLGQVHGLDLATLYAGGNIVA